MSVVDGPLDGYYRLALPSATSDTFINLQLGSQIPASTFQTVFSVASPSGAVGPSSPIENTLSTTVLTGASGTWIGSAPDGVIFNVNNTGCDSADDLQLDLTQSGATLTGTITLRTRATRGACGQLGAVQTTVLTNGMVDGTNVSFVLNDSTGRFVATFSGTVSGSGMTGVILGGSDNARVGTFSATRQ
jgi:hypothetical protein